MNTPTSLSSERATSSTSQARRRHFGRVLQQKNASQYDTAFSVDAREGHTRGAPRDLPAAADLAYAMLPGRHICMMVAGPEEFDFDH